MRETLGSHGVSLELLHGDPLPEELTRQDVGELSWARRVSCRYWLGGRICTLDLKPLVAGTSLLISTSENRLLPLQLSGGGVGPPLALWGHGKNFQATLADMPSEILKRAMARRAAWWFAYTNTSAAVLREIGVPVERITVVNNASDTRIIAAHLASLGPERRLELRREFNLGTGPIGIAIQSLHRDKRLSLLFAAAAEVRRRIPDFELVVLGDGPERELAQRAAQSSGGWIHWLGPRFDCEKAKLLAVSQVMLNPGMIGLGVLDSLVAAVPIVTCSTSRHSPEIDYLQPDINGLVAPDDVAGYANEVVRVLTDVTLHRRLSSGATQTAATLTIENMSARFCEGILQCLTTLGARRSAGTLESTMESAAS